jgi:hypothetical protein
MNILLAKLTGKTNEILKIMSTENEVWKVQDTDNSKDYTPICSLIIICIRIRI